MVTFFIASALASTRSLDAAFYGSAADDGLGEVVGVADVSSGGGPSTDGNADLILRMGHLDYGTYEDVGGVLVVPGPFSGAVDPAVAETSGTDATLFVGEQDRMQAGDSFSADGDFNADGVLDLAIGAPGYTSGSTAVGRLYIYFGPVATGVVELSTSTADCVIEGDGSIAALGQAMTAVDLDTDGYAELVVGVGTFAGVSGNVLIYSGADIAASATLDAEADYAGLLYGGSGDAFGTATVRHGEHSFLVGDPFCDEGAPNGGCVFMFGDGSAIPDGSAYDADWILSGLSATGQFGLSIASLDFWSGGLLDVAVSDADERVWIFEAPATSDDTGSAAIELTVDYGANGQYTRLANAGPVNRDNAEELLVGNWLANLSGPSTEGAVFLLYGELAPDTYTMSTDLCGTADAVCISGSSANEHFGTAVAGGDANRDGRSDILIGADNFGGGEGRAFFYYGPFEAVEGTIALEDADTVATGDDSSDGAGWSVSGVGDVNCDGVPDVAVGAVSADESTAATGAVYVFFGSTPDSAPLEWLNATMALGTADMVIYGGDSGDWLGNAVAGAGDLDADGCDDLLVAAAGDDAAASEAGTVYLFYGDAAHEGATYYPSDADAEFRGKVADEHIGTALDGAGDLDEDGYGDFLIGSAFTAAAGTDAGAVFVWYGGATRFSGVYTPTMAPCVYTGEDAGDLAGWAVAGGLNFDGDGGDLPDIAIGAPGNEDGGNMSGSVYVLFGDGSRCSGANSLSAADVRIDGALGNEQLGRALAFAPDIDGDEADDLVAGAPKHNLDKGRVYVIPGQGSGTYTAPAGGVILCPAADANQTDLFGWSVAAPSIDGDAYGDVLVGAPQYESSTSTDEGGAFLFFGSTLAGWWADGSCHYATAASATLLGDAAGDAAGWDVADAGDVDQDGEDDLLIGAYSNDAGGTGAGAAYVVLSSH
jgi:hypothetical protein